MVGLRTLRRRNRYPTAFRLVHKEWSDERHGANGLFLTSDEIFLHGLPFPRISLVNCLVNRPKIKFDTKLNSNLLYPASDFNSGSYHFEPNFYHCYVFKGSLLKYADSTWRKAWNII